MYVERLVQRVVELLEGTPFPHVDSASVLSMMALVLVGAGLVTLQNYPLGGHEHLPLLVAEPFPRVEASIGIVPVTTTMDDSLLRRLRRHVAHPSVDALVVAVTCPGVGPLPRTIDGVPVHAVTLSTGATPGGQAPTAPR